MSGKTTPNKPVKSNKPSKPNPRSKRIIKISCIAGAAILFLAGSMLIWTALRTKSGIFSIKGRIGGSSWTGKLKKFDDNYAWFEVSRGETNLELMLTMLSTMEKTAVGAEEQLSVLKRRRALSKIDKRFLVDYRDAAVRAAERYPHSAVIAALAAESIVELGGTAGRGESLAAYAKVLAAAGPLAESSSLPLAFCFYALSGNLRSPQTTVKIERGDDLFLIGVRGLGAAESESMLVNAAILHIIRGDIEGAAPFLTPIDTGKITSSAGSAANEAAARLRDFLAEYSYDFGDLMLAARIWTASGKTEDIARAADAFYLAGRRENAIQLWRALATSGGRSRAYYNIASTGTDLAEKRAALESLLANEQAGRASAFSSKAALYGTLLYTRLISAARGLAILETYTAQSAARRGTADGGAADGGTADGGAAIAPLSESELALFELELFRRRVSNSGAESRETLLEKSIADTWLLLDRFPHEAFLYRWAAWYFDFQRRYDDSEFLIQSAEKRGINGVWIPLNRAITALREGNNEAALKILNSIEPSAWALPEDDSPNSAMREENWPIDANIGLLFESRHDYRGALSSFKAARANIPKNNRRGAARLELKLARCYAVLGQNAEARQAVLNAAALDGENINVRVALNRLPRQ